MIFLAQKSTILFVCFLFLFFLSNCQPRISKHGNFFNPDSINYIKKTKLNKSEVLEIFGNPTTKSTFSDNVWYYISQVHSEKAYFEIKNISNTVLKITFDKNKNVKKYMIITEKDSIDIAVSNDTTVSSFQTDQNLLREFFSIFVRELETKQ